MESPSPSLSKYFSSVVFFYDHFSDSKETGSSSAMAMFVKVLTKIDVERTLSIPDGCLQAVQNSQGNYGKELQVKDDVGIRWNFRCIIRAGVVPKLDIVSGWIQFVRFKQLNSGDSVVLYRDDDSLTGANYKIEVLRRHESSSFVQKI